MSENLELFDRLPAMTFEEKVVWKILREHRKYNPISRTLLADMTGLPAREIQKIVRRLITDFGKNIGSSTDNKNPGYYIVSSLKEAEDVCEGLTRRALRILARVAKLKKTTIRELVQQLPLEYNDGK